MKRFIAAALLAALTAAPALAQSAPPPARTNPAMSQQFQQMHAQMMNLHKQARGQILASLSASHRALLAQTVGSLATSPNPDYGAAAKRLDAALSSSEKSNILSIAKNTMTQMRALMKNMPQGPMMRGPMMGAGMQGRMMDSDDVRSDPGRILLMVASMPMGMDHGMMMRH